MKCLDVCEDTTLCSRQCTDGGRSTTCGAYSNGNCRTGCAANWILVSHQEVGVWTESSDHTGGCYFYSVWNDTYHDTKCNRPDMVLCHHEYEYQVIPEPLPYCEAHRSGLRCPGDQ